MLRCSGALRADSVTSKGSPRRWCGGTRVLFVSVGPRFSLRVCAGVVRFGALRCLRPSAIPGCKPHERVDSDWGSRAKSSWCAGAPGCFGTSPDPQTSFLMPVLFSPSRNNFLKGKRHCWALSSRLAFWAWVVPGFFFVRSSALRQRQGQGAELAPRAASPLDLPELAIAGRSLQGLRAPATSASLGRVALGPLVSPCPEPLVSPCCPTLPCIVLWKGKKQAASKTPSTKRQPCPPTQPLRDRVVLLGSSRPYLAAMNRPWRQPPGPPRMTRGSGGLVTLPYKAANPVC